MAKKTGLEGAFADDGVTPGASIASAEPDQGSLLEDDELAAEAEAAEAMFGFALDGSKGGRPAGRRNKSTAEVKRFVQAMGADPVVAASRVVRGGPGYVMQAGLAQLEEFQKLKRDADGRVISPIYDKEGAITGWTLVDPPVGVRDAWTIWTRLVDFLGPYVHSKQPIDVKVEQPGMAIQINVGSPQAAASIEAMTGGRLRYTLDPEISDTYEAEPVEVTRSPSHTDQSSD